MTAPRQTFRRQQRILSSSDFSRALRRSRRSQDALFTVCAHYRDRKPPRLGLAMSKRAARHAVARNRLKRHIRELFRHLQHDLAGADYVVLNKPAAARASASELRASLEQHFRRLGQKRREPNDAIKHNDAHPANRDAPQAK